MRACGLHVCVCRMVCVYDCLGKRLCRVVCVCVCTTSRYHSPPPQCGLFRRSSPRTEWWTWAALCVHVGVCALCVCVCVCVRT